MPSVAEIRAYQAEEECGIFQARRDLRLKAAKEALAEAETVEDLKEVIRFILDEAHFPY